MVFQEFSLIPTLTVAQNIFLTREPRAGWVLIDDRAEERRTRVLFAEMEVDVDPRTLGRRAARPATGSSPRSPRRSRRTPGS